jgi:hypothetical protein
MKALHLAGAVMLCAALAFTGCANKTEQSTDTSTIAATTAPIVKLAGGYIVIPVYPGATVSTNDRTAGYDFGPLVAVKVYSTKDDAKRVADWYTAHLPASWETSVQRNKDTIVGTFSEERKDGGIQSVIVETWDHGTTRIQIATNRNGPPRKKS